MLFETTTGKLWVANATKEGKPAAEQPYHAFDFPALLTHQADPSAPTLPAPPAAAKKAARAPRAGRWSGDLLSARDLPVPTLLALGLPWRRRNNIQEFPKVHTPMIRFLTTFVCVAALQWAAGPAHAQSTKIDLRTTAGTEAVKGQWRYHDVKIIEVAGKNKDGSPNKTYSYEPKAKGPEFDDSGWEVIAPETLKNARATARSASAGTGSR